MHEDALAGPETLRRPCFRRLGREPALAGPAHRRMIVGPNVNQPQPYEGYEGFVGWMAITQLRSGRWLHVFSSGYWHASPPQTEETVDAWQSDPVSNARLQGYRKAGMPRVQAPRGGQAHIMHSDDRGKTWSAPRTLMDTPGDDRHPCILEVDDGALLGTLFDSYLTPGAGHNIHMRSLDNGTTWIDRGDLGSVLPAHEPKWAAPPDRRRDDSAGNSRRSDGPAIQLSDGSILWVGGAFRRAGSDRLGAGVYRSTDRGKTFALVAVVTAGHRLDEPAIAELPDGRLIMVFRPKGDVSWSDDGGRTWSPPLAMPGIPSNFLYDPHLLLLPTGVLACFHGSYTGGGLRVLLSPDNGYTWHGPGNERGYLIDNVYGYSHAMLLHDGTVYIVYNDSGGHGDDRKTAKIWGLRIGISPEADGIAILPQPE